MPTAPLVRVVVVSYEGGDVTLKCLRALRASEWPEECLEIVLVDNASSDGVADTVERELADVRVVRSPTNRGFAGGCNLGLVDLGDAAYVAFVNNDAFVARDWLRPLVDALADDPALGAACPKILLAGAFHELTLRAPTARRAGRDVGVWMSGARVGNTDVWSRTQLVRGFWGLEPPERRWPAGQWTGAEALLRLPIDDAGPSADAQLRLAASRPTTATIASGDQIVEVPVGIEPTWVPVAPASASVTVVNNAGSILTTDGHGADRGYLEPDDGRFDTTEDVFAWCGAAVVLRRECVDDVGRLDERLFLYYEDLEHAWRGAGRGWRYRYVPTSVVQHVHAATTIEGSALKLYHEERNRLLVLTRHAEARVAWSAVLRHPLATASYARRDIFSRLVHARRPRGSIVWRRLRALGAFVIRAPGMLRSRRTDRLQRRG